MQKGGIVMATINEVAKAANVSKSTVSNVFNNKGYMSEETRRKVYAAAKELDYYPNRMASALASKRTNMIGLFLDEMNAFRNMHYKLIEGISIELNKYNYKTVLYFGSDMESLHRGIVSNAEPIDAAIILNPIEEDIRIKDLVSSNSNIVIIGQLGHVINGYKNIVSIDIDNVDIAYSVTKELLELGHRRFAFINSKPNMTITADRLKGYLKALREFNISFDPAFVFNCNNSREMGRKLAIRILNIKDITAIVTESDIVASGVYEEMALRKLTVAKDISIFALGGNESNEKPEISSVKIDYKEIGERAARKVIALLNNENVENEVIKNYNIKKTHSVNPITCHIKYEGGIS